MSLDVALVREPAARYPSDPPFHPDALPPELGFLAAGLPAGPRRPNSAHALVRECLRRLGADATRYGRADWNPLGAWIRPGDRVVVKPNLVMHEREDQRGLHCLVTHASVVRAVLDYVFLAGGRGARVMVADAPLQGADFERIVVETGLERVVRFYREELGFDLTLVDLRRARAVVDRHGFHAERIALAGDPAGYGVVRLDGRSALEPITAERTPFRVTDYDPAVMQRHHGPGRHEYLLSASVLGCDALINVPKLKTHQKTGLTVCLKNLVGVNGDKDWLPHFRRGAREGGGDEYPDRGALSSWSSELRSRLQGRHRTTMLLARGAWRLYKRTAGRAALDLGPTARRFGTRIADGAWYGNDTCWRMVVDLNRALVWARADGALGDTPAPRRRLAIVDGIVGGEGDGPLLPRPKPAGVILAGDDPLAVDVVAASLMGFDWRRVPLLREAARCADLPLSDFRGALEDLRVNPAAPELAAWTHLDLGFAPAPAWAGEVERAS